MTSIIRMEWTLASSSLRTTEYLLSNLLLFFPCLFLPYQLPLSFLVLVHFFAPPPMCRLLPVQCFATLCRFPFSHSVSVLYPDTPTHPVYNHTYNHQSTHLYANILIFTTLFFFLSFLSSLLLSVFFELFFSLRILVSWIFIPCGLCPLPESSCNSHYALLTISFIHVLVILFCVSVGF